MSFKQWFARWGLKHWERKKLGKLNDLLLQAIKEIAERAYNYGYEQGQKDTQENFKTNI